MTSFSSRYLALCSLEEPIPSVREDTQSLSVRMMLAEELLAGFGDQLRIEDGEIGKREIRSAPPPKENQEPLFRTQLSLAELSEHDLHRHWYGKQQKQEKEIAGIETQECQDDLLLDRS